MSDIIYHNRYTQQDEKELVLGEAYLKWLYGTGPGKLALHALVKRAGFSNLLGWWYNRPASKKQIPKFISQYGINMEESLLPADRFEHFNDFFYRKLKPGSRPVDPNTNLAAFPADARHMGWEDASCMQNVFIKGQKFDITALLGNSELGKQYEHGSVVLSRLCPTDYHRFHFPVSGTPHQATLIPGPLASVSPHCLRSKLAWLWTNKRMLTLMDTAPWGQIAIVDVGATGVSGIHQTYQPDSYVNKGDEKGYFSFGGSTVMTLFLPGRIKLCDDLLSSTAECKELFARQGDVMGCVREMN